jgi:drug/metabolite transporter (DMT)-like permease
MNEKDMKVQSAFLPVLIFCFAGSGLTVLNKILVSKYFPFPSFLTFVQCFCTAAFIRVGKFAMPNSFEVEDITPSKCRSWSPLVVLFLIMLVSSMFALQKVTVTTLIVVRNLTTLTTAVSDFQFLKSHFNKEEALLLFLMFFGACMYGLNDISFDWSGYLYLLLNCFATTAYQIRVKQLVTELKMKPLTMSLYNNLLCLPLLLTLSALQGEISPNLLMMAIADNYTLCLILLSAIFGFVLSVTAFRLNQLVSATAIMIINNANKFLLILFSEAVLGKSLDLMSGFGCSLVLASSFAYSRLSRTRTEKVESKKRRRLKRLCILSVTLCTLAKLLYYIQNSNSMEISMNISLPKQIHSQSISDKKAISKLAHHGIMIVKDEGELLTKWLSTHSQDFDSIVCVDGSESNETLQLLQGFANINYIHERELRLKQYTDTEIRQSALDILTAKYGYGFWVTMAHCDEFYYHDPRKIVQLAEDEDVDGIYWFALHVLPHPSEYNAFKVNTSLPATTLFHHYHYYGEKGGFQDFRSFKHNPKVHFRNEWSAMKPEGLNMIWSEHPAYLHYKVKQVNVKNYDKQGHNLQSFAQARKKISPQ